MHMNNEIPVNEQPVLGQEDSEVSIDLFRILGLLWSRKFVIMAVMLVAAILAVIKIAFFTADVFTVDGVLYVSNKTEFNTASKSDMVNTSDISASRMMSETYMEILTTRAFFSDVSDAIGGVYTWEQIQKMMSIAVLNETELLKVTVKSGTAEDAYLVADAIMKQAPIKLSEIFDGGDIRIVENAVVPDEPDSKGLLRTLAIALMIAFVLSCGVIVVIDFFDTTIHRSEDITKRYNISILGEISQ